MKGVDSIKAALLPVFEKHADVVVFAYLFGSAAKEEPAPLSDIDIAAFLSPASREFHPDMRLSLYADVCRALKRNDIDLLILNTAGNIILLDEIVRQGTLLFERDPGMREDFELKILHQAIDFREQRFAVMGR